jgi:hypothetical protein
MSDMPWYSAIAVEGACDRFCGRPLYRNPYAPTIAQPQFEAWEYGWQEADHLLDVRGQEEASRWLAEAA